MAIKGDLGRRERRGGKVESSCRKRIKNTHFTLGIGKVLKEKYAAGASKYGDRSESCGNKRRSSIRGLKNSTRAAAPR